MVLGANAWLSKNLKYIIWNLQEHRLSLLYNFLFNFMFWSVDLQLF